MSRRARGEGTVVRDGDGWIARIELPIGPDGKRRRRKRRARSKADAHEALRQMQREYDDLLNPDGASRLVSEVVANFLATQPNTNRAEHTIYLDEWRASMITRRPRAQTSTAAVAPSPTTSSLGSEPAAMQPMLTIVELCGRNGLRPSEARGLRWQCVDLDRQTLTANRQMPSRDKLTKPKTKRARRTISIDEETIECLDSWRQKQSGAREAAGDLWHGGKELIVTTRVGTPINRNNLKRSIRRRSVRGGVDPDGPSKTSGTGCCDDQLNPG